MYGLFRALAQLLEQTARGARLTSHVRRNRALYETVARALLTVAMLIMLHQFVVESCTVQSNSMAGALREHDRILNSRLAYRLAAPQRGDIVVFHPPPALQREGWFVKRIVGLPGDTLCIRRDGRLWVNRQPAPQPLRYQGRALLADEREITVPPGEVYVLGDNSANSSDSRDWGGVPLERLRGRAFFRFWPPHRIGFPTRPAPK